MIFESLRFVDWLVVVALAVSAGFFVVFGDGAMAALLVGSALLIWRNRWWSHLLSAGITFFAGMLAFILCDSGSRSENVLLHPFHQVVIYFAGYGVLRCVSLLAIKLTEKGD